MKEISTNNVYMGRKIISFSSIDSTNDYILKNIENLQEGVCVQADFQEAGKGRLGRTWKSDEMKGLYFSVLIAPKVETEKLSQITMMTAVAVSKALENAGLKTEIKWPNDILINGKKIVGILTEHRAINEKNYLVIGVGVNVSFEENDFPESIKDVSTSMLLETGNFPDLETLLIDMLFFMDKEYIEFIDTGNLKNDYLNRHNSLRECLIRIDGELKKVNIIEIDKDGRLVAELDGKTMRIVSGEIIPA